MRCILCDGLGEYLAFSASSWVKAGAKKVGKLVVIEQLVCFRPIAAEAVVSFLHWFLKGSGSGFYCHIWHLTDVHLHIQPFKSVFKNSHVGIKFKQANHCNESSIDNSAYWKMVGKNITSKTSFSGLGSPAWEADGISILKMSKVLIASLSST